MFATGQMQRQGRRGFLAESSIEHGHSSQLHDAVRSQIDWLKRAEVHDLVVRSTVHSPLGACGTQDTGKEELRTRIPPHQAVPLQVKIGRDVE
jgi:hypothetical protein